MQHWAAIILWGYHTHRPDHWQYQSSVIENDSKIRSVKRMGSRPIQKRNDIAPDGGKWYIRPTENKRTLLAALNHEVFVKRNVFVRSGLGCNGSGGSSHAKSTEQSRAVRESMATVSCFMLKEVLHACTPHWNRPPRSRALLLGQEPCDRQGIIGGYSGYVRSIAADLCTINGR